MIASIRERRQVTKLALGHNALGDVGCVRLFAYLRSDDGRARDRITEISLNSNNVGEAGLLAIAAWLDGNTACADLFLQDVRPRPPFTPTSRLAARSRAADTLGWRRTNSCSRRRQR